ncbi:MAG: Sir2 family NAD-dependent protein deacetylase, partial [Flavobacteriales bacterium]|nr:Sir2 family NAD-dependent protein deacetylase [Flavobacteriales bacterium]
MQKLVVLSGAGVSAESGLKTFRDSDGLWEEYDVMEVATPEAWNANPTLVLDFYNKRREQVLNAQPNSAHVDIAGLDKKYDVTVITQNIDDLHERSGSKNVLHLHGQITQSRSSVHEDLIYELNGGQIKIGDLCESGAQLRPNIVWFGEAVPNISIAQEIVSQADILLIVGTSLNVYPAAGLIHCADFRVKKFLVDPKYVHLTDIENLEVIKEKATVGVPQAIQSL